MVQRIARRVHVEYSSRMRIALSLVMLIILAGCSQPNVDAPPPSEGSLFNASAMRIHPIFSQIKDWTGDEKPDGFEVLLEFQDQRSEEHTSELQSPYVISYAVFCLKK